MKRLHVEDVEVFEVLFECQLPSGSYLKVGSDIYYDEKSFDILDVIDKNRLSDNTNFQIYDVRMDK